MRMHSVRHKGYTLIELTLVMVIIAILVSITIPHFGLVLQRTMQAKAKSNLSNVRSGINLFYSEHEGTWPFSEYIGTDYEGFVDMDGKSLTQVLVPRYLPNLPIPQLRDNCITYNGIPDALFDADVMALMTQSPIVDVYIQHGPAAETAMLSVPYVFDNKTGIVYYPDNNLDTTGVAFYNW